MTKKNIMIYDAGTLVCTVDITIDMSMKQNPIHEQITILKVQYGGINYEVLYLVGMDYGIIIPEMKNPMEFSDDVNIH